ncbi:MAG TPA: energy transducer TonB [Stellaceae bacterium]|nr:energy transducer TonB [Stellaceae bacterium]
MFVKTASLVAAAAIGVMSIRAFADPVMPTQVAAVPAGLALHVDRPLVSKTTLAWPTHASPYRETRVILHYTIEPNGTVDHVDAVFAPADPAFAQAAKAAVSSWVYAPSATATPNAEAVAYFHAAK